MKLKRTLALVILGGFIAGVVWWCGTLPLEQRHLYRAVPADAIWIGEHLNLAERWPNFSRSPVTPLLLKNLGFQEAEVEKALKSPGLPSLLNSLARRHTLVGYSPTTAGPQAPGIFVVSWAGRDARLMALGFYRNVLKDFSPVRIGGRRIWVQPMKGGCPYRYLSLAVHDGIFLACLSNSPHGVLALLYRMLYGGELAPPLALQLKTRPHRLSHLSSPDRGWLQIRTGDSEPVLLSYFLDLKNSHGFSGWLVTSPGKLPAITMLRDAARLPLGDATVGTLLNEMPDALAFLPSAGLLRLAEYLPRSPLPISDIVASFVSAAEDNAPAFVALGSEKYGGRVLGVKVPTLLLGVRCREGESHEDFVSGHLDRLNAKFGWGLIPVTGSVAEFPISVLQSTRPGIYASLRPEERCAVGRMGRWILFSTNAETLRTLMASLSDRGERKTSWWQTNSIPADARMCAWVNLSRTTSSVANVLAVYSLAMLMKGGHENSRARKTIENLRIWTDRLNWARTLTVALRPGDDEVRIDFQLTAQSTGDAAAP